MFLRNEFSSNLFICGCLSLNFVLRNTMNKCTQNIVGSAVYKWGYTSCATFYQFFELSLHYHKSNINSCVWKNVWLFLIFRTIVKTPFIKNYGVYLFQSHIVHENYNLCELDAFLNLEFSRKFDMWKIQFFILFYHWCLWHIHTIINRPVSQLFETPISIQFQSQIQTNSIIRVFESFWEF